MEEVKESVKAHTQLIKSHIDMLKIFQRTLDPDGSTIKMVLPMYDLLLKSSVNIETSLNDASKTSLRHCSTPTNTRIWNPNSLYDDNNLPSPIGLFDNSLYDNTVENSSFLSFESSLPSINNLLKSTNELKNNNDSSSSKRTSTYIPKRKIEETVTNSTHPPTTATTITTTTTNNKMIKLDAAFGGFAKGSTQLGGVKTTRQKSKAPKMSAASTARVISCIDNVSKVPTDSSHPDAPISETEDILDIPHDTEVFEMSDVLSAGHQQDIVDTSSSDNNQSFDGEDTEIFGDDDISEIEAQGGVIVDIADYTEIVNPEVEEEGNTYIIYFDNDEVEKRKQERVRKSGKEDLFFQFMDYKLSTPRLRIYDPETDFISNMARISLAPVIYDRRVHAMVNVRVCSTSRHQALNNSKAQCMSLRIARYAGSRADLVGMSGEYSSDVLLVDRNLDVMKARQIVRHVLKTRFPKHFIGTRVSPYRLPPAWAPFADEFSPLFLAWLTAASKIPVIAAAKKAQEADVEDQAVRLERSKKPADIKSAMNIRNGEHIFNGMGDKTTMKVNIGRNGKGIRGAPTKTRTMANVVEVRTVNVHPPGGGPARGAKYGPCPCANCMNGSNNKGKKGKQEHICSFPECNKVFTLAGNFRRHLLMHTGEQPFLCSWEGCGRRFLQKSHLTDHSRIHTGEKPFLCSWEGCGRRFTKKGSLTEHSFIHTGEKRHECPVCLKKFATKSLCNKHVKKIHK